MVEGKDIPLPLQSNDRHDGALPLAPRLRSIKCSYRSRSTLLCNLSVSYAYNQQELEVIDSEPRDWKGILISLLVISCICGLIGATIIFLRPRELMDSVPLQLLLITPAIYLSLKTWPLEFTHICPSENPVPRKEKCVAATVACFT